MSTTQLKQTKQKSSKTKSFIKTGFLVGAATLILAGCGSGSPKEEYLDAYSSMMDAKTIDASYNIAIDSEELDKFDLGLDMKSDNEADKHEVDVKLDASVEGFNLNMELPIYMETDEDGVVKSYTKSEGFGSMTGMFMSMFGMPFSLDIPEEYKGKIIEMDMEEELGIEVESENDTEFAKNYHEFLSNIDEKEFTKKGDTITYSVDGEKAYDVITNAFGEDMFSMDEFGLTGMSDGNETEFGLVEVEATIKGGKLVDEKLFMPMIVTDYAGEKQEMTLTATGIYNNINGKIDFTFDMKEENLITADELAESMFGGFGDMDFEYELDESNFETEFEDEENN